MAVGEIQQSTKKGTRETAMPLLPLSPLPSLLPSPQLMLSLSPSPPSLSLSQKLPLAVTISTTAADGVSITATAAVGVAIAVTAAGVITANVVAIVAAIATASHRRCRHHYFRCHF
jgi:hypothetical protein